MARKKRKQKSNIRNVIIESFIVASVIILVVTVSGSLIFNDYSVEWLRKNNLNKVHEVLSHLITPAVTIADSSEIRRLLGLASGPNETFAVINDSGDILLPDYTQLSLVREAIKNHLTRCNEFETTKAKFSNRHYWITCTPLVYNDALATDEKLGTLLSFSQFSWWENYSSLLFCFIGIAIISLFSILIWFRRVLQPKLLRPLIELCDYIESPNEAIFLKDFHNAPDEIKAIKENFDKVLANLQAEFKKRNESEKKTVLLDLAAQVAHDIRSPLSVMEISLEKIITNLSDSQYLILKNAIQSIRDIANNLLSRYQSSSVEVNNKDGIVKLTVEDDGNTDRYILLSSILDTIASQKKQEWQNNPCFLQFEIKEEAKFKWIYAAPNDIKRNISNLLNNAYEALKENREIKLILATNNDQLELKIQDQGHGIPAHIIDNVLNGLSLKHDGQGLGLSTAKRYMEAINGRLLLSSIEKHSTMVTLLFKTFHPTWFPKSITLPVNSPIIILDDDISIHSFWREYIQSVGRTAIHFSRIDDVIKWYEKNTKVCHDAIFFMDYEIRDDQRNGLILLEQINPKTRGFLITSHAEELYVQCQCNKLGVWLMPKNLLLEVILSTAASNAKPTKYVPLGTIYFDETNPF